MSMDSTDAPQMIEHIRKSLTFTPHDVKWIPSSARFISVGISASGKGVLNLHELCKGDLETKLDCPNICSKGIKCATLGASRIQDRHLAFGDYGGGLSIHDLERYQDTSSTSVDTNKSSSVASSYSTTSLSESDSSATSVTDPPSITDSTIATAGSTCTFSRNNSMHSTTRSSSKPKEIFSVKAHDNMVNAIDGIGGSYIGYGAPEICTGGRDGKVCVWDPRVNHAVVTLVPGKNVSARDCWTVSFGNSFNDEERCVCAGYDNGDVKLFDLRTSSVRWETNCKNGITSTSFDRKDIEMNKLIVTTLESKFRCYDMRTQHSKEGFAYKELQAHRSTVWIAKHLPQNRDVFMTGGGNGGVNLYKYHYPISRVGKNKEDHNPIGVVGEIELLNSRVISTQPIVSVDWSPDRAGLCCLASLDQSLRVYIVTKLDKH